MQLLVNSFCYFIIIVVIIIYSYYHYNYYQFFFVESRNRLLEEVNFSTIKVLNYEK